MRARGANLALAPVVDVARDPRWGRTEETFGEDPYLVTQMGLAAIRGFQGETLPLPADKVFVTLKHMTGHGQPENGTNVGPADISERTLRTNFFPPFEQAVKRMPVRAIMASYNEIDGVPSHASGWLLNTVLRGEWGYQGAVISDYQGVREMINRHRICADLKEAGEIALNAGVDQELPDGEGFLHLPALLEEGKVSLERIDEAVRRTLRIKFEGGWFENPFVDPDAADAVTATPEAVALAREAAQRSVVLLKNDGLLPLDPAQIGKLAVIGPHAQDTPLGGYSEIPRHVVSVVEGLEAAANGRYQVAFAEGVRLTESRDWWADQIVPVGREVNDRSIEGAVALARQSDTVLLVLGDNEQTSREGWADDHLGDRPSLDLFGQQEDLARAVLALGKPTVVLLLNGRPLSVTSLAERAAALVEGWYLGQETGHAIADILLGHVSPGGKLPVSIARSVGQLPIYYNHKPSARRGYMDDSTAPLFPFGFGLSYTRFEMSAPRLERDVIAPGETVQVSIDVANVGNRAGDEVVQLYVRDELSSVTRPVLELRRFERVTLKPGERRTVTFELGPDDLALWNAAMDWVVEPGTFTLLAGPNARDLKGTVLTVREAMQG